MVEEKHVISCPSCGGLNRTLRSYTGLIKCSHCNHMFPHGPDNQSINSDVIDLDIKPMTPKQKIVKGLQLLVGFYSSVLMLVILLLILDFVPISDYLREIGIVSNTDYDSSSLDFDGFGKLIIGICCMIPVAWHWYAFSLILGGTNQLFFD